MDKDKQTPVDAPEDTSESQQTTSPQMSRRGFLQASGVGALAAQTIHSATAEAKETPPQVMRKDKVLRPDRVALALTVNGKAHNVVIETRMTLAEVLRETLGLTGTKVVCDRGACGGCTVQLNGAAVCSCMTLACDAHGAKVNTIEGLATGDKLHPLQEAFVECDALQCGFCTPGMIMSCKTLLDQNAAPSLDQVKEAVAGNLCRCGTYPHVFEATLLAAKRMSSASRGAK